MLAPLGFRRDDTSPREVRSGMTLLRGKFGEAFKGRSASSLPSAPPLEGGPAGPPSSAEGPFGAPP